MKIKPRTFVFLSIAMLLFLCACGQKASPITGIDKRFCHAWFEQGEEDANFTLYSDGTCDIADIYGIGTWAIVNNDQLKITDYYGSSDVYIVQSVSNSKLVLIQDGYTKIFWNSATAAAAAALENTPEVIFERFSAPKNYNDGLAWIMRSYDDNYYACINKSGEVLFQFPAEGILSVSDYSSGYAHILREDYVAIIDTEGDILSSYALDENNVFMAYGDGYTVIESYSGGFDSSEYIYNIYDPYGNVIDNLSNEGKQYASVNYCGNGSFAFRISDDEYFYYFAATQQSIFSEHKTLFYDDMAIEEIYEVFDEFSNYFGTYIRFFDTNGECFERAVEPSDILDGNYQSIIDRLGEFTYNDTIGTAIVKDGICILNYASYNSDFYYNRDFILSYDIENDSLYSLDEAYSDKLITDLMPDETVLNSNRLALPLQGDDGELYVAVFDEHLNIILEPTRMDSYRPYADGRMIITLDDATYVYDENGNIVFTNSDVGYFKISDYSDGAALVEDEAAGIVYLDKEGNTLFESITSSGARNISEQLPWWDSPEE